MKVKEMTFSKSVKIKAPNYGNQGDIHYSITIAVEENEQNDIDKIAKAGWQDVDFHIETQAKEMMKALGIPTNA